MRRLTFWETGLLGASAGLLALPTGYILAWILIFIINQRSFGWTLQMQLETLPFIQAFAGGQRRPACRHLPCVAPEPYANRRSPAWRVTHAAHVQKSRLSHQNLPGLRASVRLAEKMAQGLGEGGLLFRKMPPRPSKERLIPCPTFPGSTPTFSSSAQA
jgi:hypothetical protein